MRKLDLKLERCVYDNKLSGLEAFVVAISPTATVDARFLPLDGAKPHTLVLEPCFILFETTLVVKCWRK